MKMANANNNMGDDIFQTVIHAHKTTDMTRIRKVV